MQSKSKNNTDVREEKLEDILRSIKGIIYNHNDSTDRIIDTDDQEDDLDDSILELTDEVKENRRSNSDFISKDTAEKILIAINDFTKKINSNQLKQKEKKVDIEINFLIKPMLKDWIDNNLPRLVEKIVAEELKKLIQKNSNVS
jgi:cell pole-organizing protein PopZ